MAGLASPMQLSSRTTQGVARRPSGSRAARKAALTTASLQHLTDDTMKAAPILLPVGPWKAVEGGVNAAKGFQASAIKAGVRTGVKKDVALVTSDAPAVFAGVYTQNLVAAAPVQYCREVMAAQSTTRAVLINAGQANAATGTLGYADAQASAAELSKVLGIPASAILLLSTGVIGKRIVMDKLLASLPALASTRSASINSALDAATAMTTTDLVTKSVALEAEVGGKVVRVGGMCKGSGMIHPNMATMLGVVTSDVAVTPEVWRPMFKRAALASFNQITVDGDTSTNDTVLALASGAAGNDVISDISSPAAKQLEAALTALCQGLAKSIAWDGEGATVLVEVSVLGAADMAGANIIARSVAGSSLTKAAIFGRDPNWGRIACAAGYAGVPFDPTALRIQLGDMVLMEKGQPLAFDKAAASGYLKKMGDAHGTVAIAISVGGGPGKGMAWGCDLSYDYVKINADYTT